MNYMYLTEEERRKLKKHDRRKLAIEVLQHYGKMVKKGDFDEWMLDEFGDLDTEKMAWVIMFAVNDELGDGDYDMFTTLEILVDLLTDEPIEADAELQRENKELKAKVDKLESENARLWSNNVDLANDNVEVARQNVKVCNANTELQRENNELKRKNNELKRKNNELEGEKAELAAEKDDLEDEVRDLKAEVYDLQEARDKADEVRHNIRIRLQEALDHSERENKELKKLVGGDNDGE